MTKTWLAALAATLGLAAAGAIAAEQQGVSKNEIVLGSIQDLSGPDRRLRQAGALGMLLRVDEINEQGGINGRKLKLLVEDSAYDPKKAVLAAQKLVNQDKIFIDGRRTSARRRTWRRCRCSSRRTSSTSSRSPRRARCTSRSTG